MRETGDVRRAFAPLLGLPASLVRKGHGSFLTIDFRQSSSPRPAEKDTTTDSWHLWIYCCNWRLVIGEHLAADSDAVATVIEAAAADMTGRCLLDVDSDPASGSSCFRFAGGAMLSTWPYPIDTAEHWASDEAQWMLYESGNRVFTYAADGRGWWQPGNMP